MGFPLKAPLAARQIDEDLILHDPWNGSTHRLNSVAGLIWQLCDGARDPGAITSELAARFGKPAADMAPDVDAMLARFTDIGLIHSAGGPRRETELLVRCVRTAIGTESAEWLGDLRGEDVDWTYLVQTALQHGVMPHLYRSLRANPQDAVPAVVLDRLRRHFRGNARWNLFVTRELLEILALFEAHRIPAMPLKGPVLAAAVHGSVALRQFGDLDIFVPADRAAGAKNLLTARGYRFHSSGETDAFAECARRDGTISVDLQWALAPKRFRFPIDLAQLWGRLEPVSLGSATTARSWSLGVMMAVRRLNGRPRRWRAYGTLSRTRSLVLIYRRPPSTKPYEPWKCVGSLTAANIP